MANYIIGDVQGCFKELMLLLEHIKFSPRGDRLWFAGDLVNRGPHSLEVLRFVKALPLTPYVVLGNHDLALLAIDAGAVKLKKQDTFQDVLNASDCRQLCDWLRHQSLFYYDQPSGFSLVHAGLPPQWDLAKALQCAQEVENVLRSAGSKEFFQHMYGNEPVQWDENLAGWDRLRFIINCFTRLRFCDSKGNLCLSLKGAPADQPDYFPWFKVPQRAHKDLPILFGHWAALAGQTDESQVYPLDTGCVWGGGLSALRLEDRQRFMLPCRGYRSKD